MAIYEIYVAFFSETTRGFFKIRNPTLCSNVYHVIRFHIVYQYPSIYCKVIKVESFINNIT